MISLQMLQPWVDAYNISNTLKYDGKQGHLLTITSAAEKDFVLEIYQQKVSDEGWAYIGAYQENWTNPSDGWKWVTGETWNYTNWGNGEPNDQGYGGEHSAGMDNFIGWHAIDPAGVWNDCNGARIDALHIYAIEYDCFDATGVNYPIEAPTGWDTGGNGSAAVPEPFQFSMLLLSLSALVFLRMKKHG